MNCLKELFFGNIVPFEHKIQMDKKYEKEIRQSVQMEEKFLAGLDERQKQLYQEYEKLRMKLSARTEYEFFTCGFRLGAQIMLEVIKE